jgi:hypothetical protein
MYLRLGAVATVLVALAAVILGPPSAPVYAQQPAEEFPIPGGQFYTQTRGSYPPGFGFAVVDDGIQFYTALRQLGGPAVAGYPISQRFFTGGRPAQAFQRVILIWDSTAGQAIVQPTGPNLALIPSDALVPAPWVGLPAGPGMPPAGQAPGGFPGFLPPIGGQPAPPAAPYGLPYGQPYSGQPFFGQPYGQPFGGWPYADPYGYPYGYPFGYPYGGPFYAPFAPGVPVCDPILFPWGCPPPPPAPAPTNTPVPGPPACSGENTEIYFEPRHPAVGQRTLIRVTSAYGWEYVGLTGPWNPRYEGLGPGGLNWVWTWSVTPQSPGTFQYTFTINDGTGCVTSGFSTQGTTPPPTATPVPPHNTATPTPVHAAPQQPAHNPPVQQPSHPTATPTAPPAAPQQQPPHNTATPTRPPATATPVPPHNTATPTPPHR